MTLSDILKDKHLILILVGAFTLIFLLTFPTFFFSVDELSYFSKALALSNGQVEHSQITVSGNIFSWAPANYPIGTALLLSFFAFFSKHLVFLSGLVYTLLSLFLSFLILKKERSISYIPFLIFFLFLPTIYFSRGLMSEMPSLLLVSIFTYILFKEQKKHSKYLLLGFLAGLSIILRETNIILCGGLVALTLLNYPKYILSFGAGLLIGILPRLISSTYFYSTVTYVKKYAPFGIEYFISNLPLYFIILAFLLPGGLYVLYRYKGKLANSIKLSIIAFTLVHLVYGYNSGDHSGFLVSLFYNGRYYIPTLPLWIIVYGHFAKSNSFFNKKSIKILSLSLGLFFIIGSQVFYSILEKEHKSIAVSIFKKYNDKPIIYDNVAYRYLNPLHGKINQLDILRDIRKGEASIKEKSYLVLSNRNNSAQQTKAWKNQLYNINALKDRLSIQEVEEYSIFDGTNVIVLELSPND